MKGKVVRGFMLAILTALPLGSAFAEIALSDLAGWLNPKRMKGVAPVTNERYEEECSACHFPYQPGLLPARSWNKLLNNTALADHFGENAELEPAVLADLLKYAVDNSADNSIYKRSRKIMASTPDNETPIRITEVRYIKRKHSEIPAALITGNPKVRSLSNCAACHTKAAEGVFDDDTVYIKGHGPWD